MKEEKTDHSSKPKSKEDKGDAKIYSVTFEVLALNLIIIGGGYYLDEKINSTIPWVLILSVFLSIPATIYYLLKKFGQ